MIFNWTEMCNSSLRHSLKAGKMSVSHLQLGCQGRAGLSGSRCSFRQFSVKIGPRQPNMGLGALCIFIVCLAWHKECSSLHTSMLIISFLRCAAISRNFRHFTSSIDVDCRVDNLLTMVSILLWCAHHKVIRL